MEIQFNAVLSNQFSGLVTYIKVSYLDLDYNTEKMYICKKNIEENTENMPLWPICS